MKTTRWASCTAAATLLLPAAERAKTRRRVGWRRRRRSRWSGTRALPRRAACEMLQKRGVARLRLHYRHPNELVDCTLDTLAGSSSSWKKACRISHSSPTASAARSSFRRARSRSGGADVEPDVGADLAPDVAPRPMLLIHGTADDVLSPICSRQILRGCQSSQRRSSSTRAPATGSIPCVRKCSICWYAGCRRS